MSYLDILLIIPLLWGGFKGFRKGLVMELATIAALLLGTWVSIKFYTLFSAWLKNSLNWQGEWLPLMAFAILFIGVLIGVYAVAGLADKTLKAVALGVFNKLAGAFLGAGKFALILGIILFLAEKIHTHYPFIPQQAKEKSLLYKPVFMLAETVMPHIKERL
ncbi:MAG: CvpA family protein [Flavobacteriales bacterium]|nr:CvpA family protein [Flavobacteriales bacterium]